MITIDNPLNKRIVILDASTLAHVGCLRYVQLSNREGLQPKIGSDPLDFGQALHRGIAALYRDKINTDPATLCAEKYVDIATSYYKTRMCPKLAPRTIDWLECAMAHYVDTYRFDSFSPLYNKTTDTLEITFAIKIYENETTIVILSGAVDAIGFSVKDTNKLLYIRDTKHSSTTKQKAHMEEQLGSPQFHIYSWALAQIGYNGGNPMPIQIDSVYLNPKQIGATFVRSDIKYIDKYLLDRTMSMVMFYAKLIADQLPDDKPWPHNFKECHGKYRLCEFNPICQSPDNSQHIPRQIMFTSRRYDPTTFGN